MKPEETRIFLENSFREGEIKTVGTDIDRIMPPVSRFGGGNRTKKKQTVIDKLKAFLRNISESEDLLNSQTDLTMLWSISEAERDAFESILYYILRDWKQRTPVCRVNTLKSSVCWVNTLRVPVCRVQGKISRYTPQMGIFLCTRQTTENKKTIKKH